MDVDIRFLPNQDPGEILAQIRDDRRPRDRQDPSARAGDRVAPEPLRAALRDAVARLGRGEALSIGRDGASDADLVPGGRGAGGRVRARRRRPPRPEEWVSVSSLERYRQALGDFVRGLPAWLERQEQPSLRAVEGGLA